MAFYTDDLKVGKPIGCFIVRKTTEGFDVMNLENCFIKSNSANLTSIIGSFKGEDSNLSPIITSIINSAATPSRMLFSDPINTTPLTITGKITEIIFLNSGFETGKSFTAKITFDLNGIRSSFLIKGKFGSWHKIDDFINLLPNYNITDNKNQASFNYRVRDAKRKEGQPQFKASEEEIKNYHGKFLGNQNAESFNSPRARTQRKSLDERLDDTKNKNTKSSRSYNMKKLLSEVRLGIKPNTGMEPNKINDPRGNHEGGPGSWRDFKDEMRIEFKDSYWWNFLLGTSHSNRHYKRGFEIMKKWMIENNCYDYKKFYGWYLGQKKGNWANGNLEKGQENKFDGELPFPKPECRNLGKNLPTIWQIGSEPHNFQREYDVDTDHFASFPEALCEIPIKAGCPKGGIVLDIFCGSGTALVVAKRLGRNFIGIELNKKYIEISEKRIRNTNQPLL
jgi:hypothetical protein